MNAHFHFSGVDRAEFVELIAANGGSAMINLYETGLNPKQKLWRALLEWPELNVVGDSGAFQGNKNLDAYCAQLKPIKDRLLWYANLDKIHDPLESERNYAEMLRRGFSPLWIHQPGGDLGRLREMAQENDLIGLGGVVPMLKTDEFAAQRYLIETGNTIAAFGGQAHIFGLTSPAVLSAITAQEWFKSADGQTWLVGFKARELLSRDGRRLKAAKLGLALTRAECAANNVRVINGWVSGRSEQLALFDHTQPT